MDFGVLLEIAFNQFVMWNFFFEWISKYIENDVLRVQLETSGLLLPIITPIINNKCSLHVKIHDGIRLHSSQQNGHDALWII